MKEKEWEKKEMLMRRAAAVLRRQVRQSNATLLGTREMRVA